MQPTDSPFEFAFITDTHVHSPDDWGLAHVSAAVRLANQRQVDFVIFGGDQVEDATSEDAAAAFLAEAARLQMPWYGVAGNHDVFDPALGMPPYLRFGGMQRFAFAHCGAFFIGVDSSSLRGDFGAACQRQELAYLTAEMARAPSACSQRLLIMHSPLFRFHPGEDEDWGNLPNRHQLAVLFRRQQISLLLTGHAHSNLELDWQGLHISTFRGTCGVSPEQPETVVRLVSVFVDGWRIEDIRIDATPVRSPDSAADGECS